MKITKKQDGSSMTVALSGRLDTATASVLSDALKGIESELTDLTFDFEKLDYISSAGLRELLKIKQSMKYGSTVKVANANEIVREVFRVTGFEEVVPMVH